MTLVDNERRIEEVRAARHADPASHARKKAVVIFGVVQPFARAIHNSGNLFEGRVTQRVLAGEPIQFNAFWGVGGKQIPDSHDEKLLGVLRNIGDTVNTHYEAGSRIQLMLADEHGTYNGFKPSRIYEYLVRIQDRARELDIESVWLSDLYREWGLKLPNPTEPVDPLSEFYADFWDRSDYQRQRQQLVESASRHNQAGVDPNLAAYHYARMRRMEAPYLAATFPDRILLANTSKDLGKPLLPNEMPHIYMKAAPAWFLGDS